MIHVRNLEKRYEGRAVLRDLSFSVAPGEIFGVVGHSGAGKSTLLRCCNGLEGFQGGSVHVMGKDVASLDEAGLQLLRRDMGMIFQNFNLMGRKNVFENVAFPLRVWKTPEAETRDRVMELLRLVGLVDKRRERVQSLSGGEKQRIGIARALALNPKLLLCDEATSALDPETTGSILDLLEDVNARFNLTLLVVTHQMEVVKRLCRRLLLLDKGVVQSLGKTEDIFISPDETLKKFVEDEFTLLPAGTNIRMMFPRAISRDAVITTMARELDVSFSIVGGKLERYLDDVLGYLIINVPDGRLEAVLRYLHDHNLYWEVLDAGGYPARRPQ